MASRADRDTTQLSKTLSYLLRHGSKEHRLKMDTNGFSKLDDVITTSRKMLPRQTITTPRIEDIVKNCKKQRFKIVEIDGVKFIRANQGHTLKDVESADLKVIEHFEDGPTGKIIHGTTQQAWQFIKSSGLNKMKRNHIHMARGNFGEAKSGARSSSNIIITINGNQALKDGIQFFESDNGVILSPGNDNGTIETKYFIDVYDQQLGKQIFP